MIAAPQQQGAAQVQGANMATIPPISLSAGPSAADGQASATGSAATGAFNFKGSSSADAGSAWLPLVAIALVAGVAIWATR